MNIWTFLDRYLDGVALYVCMLCALVLLFFVGATKIRRESVHSPCDCRDAGAETGR